MCLYHSNEGSKTVVKRVKKKGYITAYKTLRINYQGDLVTGVQRVKLKFTEDGFLVSDRAKTQPNPHYKRQPVHKGIHVYLQKPKLHRNDDRITVAVKCYHKDFISANLGYRNDFGEARLPREAVFFQVQFNTSRLTKLATSKIGTILRKSLKTHRKYLQVSLKSAQEAQNTIAKLKTKLKKFNDSKTSK